MSQKYKNMRIGIDARFYGSIGKGLGRYTQKLIENLEKINDLRGPIPSRDSEYQYYIFLRRENWNEYQPKHPNFHKVLADIPWYGIREQMFLPRILKKYNLDLVHFPHFNVPFFWRGKFIVTIHDLILLHFKTQRASTLAPLIYFLKQLAYKIIIGRAIKKSEIIIAVSEYTKSDILKHFNVSAEKIRVTYEAVDVPSQSTQDSRQHVLAKYDIIKPYLLYVGNAYPHKNLEGLILAFREILQRHPHLRLVLVGKEDYFFRRLKNFVLENSVPNIIFTGYVRDEYLGSIYRDALLYIFPSFYEGFGLPPLEAMSRNTPVASSNAACLPEVLGQAAIYFDPRAQSEMTEKIEETIKNLELRKKLIKAGEGQVRKYNWEKMARQTRAIYENLNLRPKLWPSENK